MKFTVDARVRLSGFYRLQSNGTFRKVFPKRKAILKKDQVFGSIDEAYRQIEDLGGSVSIGGKQIRTDSELGRSLADEIADLSPVVHREEWIDIPSKEELVSAIRGANDDRNNFLLLGLQGRFSIRTQDEMDSSHPDWAVRHESFCAGNDYVGPDAAGAVAYMDGLYRDMLAGWLEHLSSGEVDCFIDEVTDLSEKQLIARIRRYVQNKPLPDAVQNP